MPTINGTTGNDTLNGTTGVDIINGLEGNDTIDAGTGDDQVDGGDGDDIITDGSGSDTISGGAGEDSIYASVGAGNDTYDGGDGSFDIVYYNTAFAGVIVDFSGATDQVTSVGGGNAAGIGTDILVNIESVWGSEFGDTMTGDDLVNQFFGRGGNDALYGGGGNDHLAGGDGDDVVDGGAGIDRVSYVSSTTGVNVSLAISGPQNTFQGTDTLIGIENLTGSLYDDILIGNDVANQISGQTGNNQIFGGGGNDTLTAGDGNDHFEGGDGNDFISGGGGNDYLDGGEGDDSLSGGAGDDYLVAGNGANSLNGGDGNDTYVVSAPTVISDSGGTDSVISSATFYLSSYVENLTLTGSADIDGHGWEQDNVLIGNSGANWLDGKIGDDHLYGGAGDDHLDGFIGNDYLDGGAGTDHMYGGAGNDTYVVVDANDYVHESADEGSDTVLSSISFALSDYSEIETLTLTGTGAIEGTGNWFANIIRGNGAANVLDGGDGDDRLLGGAGNDSLIGGWGYDRMYGEVGDDTYYVNDTTDYAYENAGEGTDQVIASIDHQLRVHVENLTLVGSAVIGKGNELGNVITGNTAANKLYGYDGDDYLDAGAGDDVLLGGGGTDQLIGGQGIDRLYGGIGDDLYYVTDATDYVYENAGEGSDIVRSAVSYTLRANVEHLVLNGDAAINGTGNELNNMLMGNFGANVLSGRLGDDTLYGMDGDDRLAGGEGNDWLDGGMGRDRMSGEAGADIFEFQEGNFAGLTSSTCDQIYDFSRIQGDKIRLVNIDGNSLLAGDQGFSFLGSSTFTGTAGELRSYQASGNTYVQGDTNGDGVGDFLIRLDGLHTLQASDFVV